ncbi:MAG: TM2 domain-containing protein [Clostridiales bacterium]|jgi:hypothetical protein|nr:TM2 domain-containing protein [Clostridiales bacterium]
MVNCSQHPQKEARGACVYCGNFFCEDCLVEIDDKFYCKEHVKMLVDKKRQSERGRRPGEYRNTPELYHNADRHTPPQNIYVNNSMNHNDGGDYPPGYRYPFKDRTIAILLCLFFGVAGFHRFYTGKIGTGLLWLFTGGFCGIGWIIDLILLIIGAFRDVNGQPLV